MKHLRNLFSYFIAIVPTNSARVFLYRVLLSYSIDGDSRVGAFTVLQARHVSLKSAVIGPLNLIRIDCLNMSKGSLIGKLNMFSKLKLLELAEDAYILHRNFIGGTYGTSVECGREELLVGRKSQISLSCFFDLSDRITLGQNVVVGGSGTQFWTHGFDHRRTRTVAPITIGNNVFIGAASTVVQDVHVCEDVTIGAGTVVHRSITAPGVYVSNSLRKVGNNL